MLTDTLRNTLTARGELPIITEYHNTSAQAGHSISGRDLNTNVTALANALQHISSQHAPPQLESLQHVPPKKMRVIVVLDAGIDFISTFLACLYSGMTIIPCPPAKSAHDLKRLQTVAADSAADALICQAHNIERFAEALPQINCYTVADIMALATTPELSGANESVELYQPQADDIAIIQYSSGSTAAPKGVLVTYQMIAHNHLVVQQRWGLSAATRGLTWLPHWHDMGLFGGILYPLLSGGCIFTLSPIAFVKRPLNWLKLISEHRITLSGGPPFAYDLVESLARDEDLAHIDLSTWKTAYCGADYVPHHTYHHFRQRFMSLGLAPSAFFACYGMAEITLFAGGEPYTDAIHERLRHSDHHLLPCYLDHNDQHITIFDMDAPVPVSEGEGGEICFSTDSALRGYLHQAATGFTYEGRDWIRSGDYGFIDEQLLYITGRLKDIIKVRGKTLFPVDFAVLANELYSELNPLVFFMSLSEPDAANELVFLIEHKHKDTSVYTADDITQLQHAFNQAFGVFIKHVNILPRGKIPKTTSGKVNRWAIDTAFLNSIAKIQ